MNEQAEVLAADHATASCESIATDTGFVLPALMTIETIEQLATEIRELQADDKGVLTLNASDVQTITTPGLQLIVSLEKKLSNVGGALVVTTPKNPFIQAFKDAGLENILKQIFVK